LILWRPARRGALRQTAGGRHARRRGRAQTSSVPTSGARRRTRKGCVPVRESRCAAHFGRVAGISGLKAQVARN